MSNGTTVLWALPQSGYDYAYCIARRNEVATLLATLIQNGGVSQYHIGSRGLVRYSIADLQNLLVFWTNAAEDARLGVTSSIQCRRGVPCDV
jgi:hypothetical protein